jgi:hypothetical protein
MWVISPCLPAGEFSRSMQGNNLTGDFKKIGTGAAYKHAYNN